jgi:2-polyprenyl-6-methoxyphenol hydroxylase-like FAD-dependent oxidoreductase
MNTDVLIVGAGPTGLMLANQLGRQGVRTMIVDRHAGPSRETRALGVQARSLEIYAGLGIDADALQLGTPGTGGNIWSGARKMARVPFGESGRSVTPYPYILVLGQDDNERIMGQRLTDWGLSVTWNTELVALEQNTDHVVVTLKGPDGVTRKITTAWVAGCDGARSSVRELSGIAFPGEPYEHVFYVADLEATGSMVPGEVNVYLWKDGFHLLFPMRGKNHWRLVGILPPQLRGRNDVTFESVIPSARTELGDGFACNACSWFSTYRIHHRRAARFRDRRCFLLGDAAHIHSPVGAQGMNTGLQDAFNLGWKLALVTRGRARADLLESYEKERLPVAERLLATTDRGFRMIVSDHWIARVMRTRILARLAAIAMSRHRIQQLAFRTISQTGIRYRTSTLTQPAGPLPKGAPQAGDRFPWLRICWEPAGSVTDSFRKLDGTRFELLSFGQPLPEATWLHKSDFIAVRNIPVDGSNAIELSRAGIPVPSFYLVRPDGYIGFCGERIDLAALKLYLESRIHMDLRFPRTAPGEINPKGRPRLA